LLVADPVAILSRLVSFRSDLVHGDERPLADHLAALLRERGADEVEIGDAPREGNKPCSWVYARYGNPKLLLNVHLDTVPPNTDWTSDPFVPRIEGNRLYALGAADTKGATAAILSALDDVKPRDTAILFSGDEEWSSVAVRAFLSGPRRAGLTHAIVCEPTSMRVGVRHRGILGMDVTIVGPGGHSSMADTVPAPLARLARLAVALDDWGQRHKSVGPPGFPGMCMNIAKLDGGIAFNVIPAQGKLSVSLRPPPGADSAAIVAELEAVISQVVPEASVRFLRQNDPFSTRDVKWFEGVLGERAAAPVDLAFWTEAALLTAAGIDTVVMGPGDIAQAHAPNEWVSLEQIHLAHDVFRNVFLARERDGSG
jgi:acetylornithine deacetylase